MTRILAALAAFALAHPAAAQMSARERQQGAQAHPQLMAEFGGAYTGPGNALVQRVGRSMAIHAGLSKTGRDCTVTLLNSTVVNAFAVPGCYIYVTRGLMAIAGDEAELASVLGHEIGHVAARHAQERQQRSTITGIGALLAGVLTGSSTVGQLAGSLGQSYVLRFSRSQEYEADKLGIGYIARAGYDPRASAELLGQLQTEEALQARLRGRDEARQPPVWLRTHPLTADRIAQARKLARAARPQGGGGIEAERYLAAIDGQLWGDDPEQGFVDGPAFAHPKLRIGFRAPPGFFLQNSSRAVVVAGPNGEQAQFGGGALERGEGLTRYVERVARSVVGQGQAEIGQFQQTTINGLQAAMLPLRARTRGGVADLSITAYDAGGGQAYHFVTVTPAGRGGWERALVGSFRRLTAAEAGALRPRVIRVVTVGPGDTVESLARRMAARDLPIERFRALNGLGPAETLRPGRKVKLVRYGGA